MGSSAVRYVALGVLMVGVAAIAWTVLGGDDSGDDSASSLGAAAVDSSAVTADAATDTTAGAATDATANGAEDSGAGSGAAASDAGDAEDTSSPATAAPSAGVDSGEETVDGSASAAATTAATTTVPPEPIEVLGTADTLTNLDGWLNTDVTSLEEIRAANELTVVQFWTFGCRNCKNTLEALGQLYADFRGQGVEIVGVHSPEFSYEADIDNIIEASADLGVIWPIALDTDKRNFHRWQPGNIGYWPRVYVIDGDNQIRFDRTGDGRATYAQLYETVERLLAEA